MVMVFHFAQYFYYNHPMIFGQTGVDLFFVLSGFLISTILLQSPHGDWHEIRNFYIRRTLRIFPLYYAYLIISSFVAPVSLWYWFYLQNFPLASSTQHLIGPGHFWSLAVEEQFYLVWPFLILFWPRRWLAQAMWGSIAFAVICRIVLVHIPTISDFPLTFTRLDGLAAGSLLALGWHRRVLANRKIMFAVGAVLSLALLAYGAQASAGQGLGWVQVTRYSASAGIYTCLMALLILTSGTIVHRLLRSRPMRALGRVSYGLYVFHPFVGLMILRHANGLSLAAKAIVFVGVSYLISVASFYGFERHFTNLKQRLAPEKPFPRAAAAA